jgi:endonuclease IV
MANLLLGMHVSKSSCLDDYKASKMSAAINFCAETFNLNCAQVFTHGPQGYNEVKIDTAAVAELSSEVNIYTHGAYTTTAVWKITSENVESAESRRTLAFIEAHVVATRNMTHNNNSDRAAPRSGVIIHISRRPIEEIVDAVQFLRPIFERHGVLLLLEMIASRSDDVLTYETPQKINKLIAALGNHSWYGICLDTAHIFASGFDCTTAEAMRDWFAAVTKKERIKMIHLNGSASRLGTGKDKHAIPFSAADNIWGSVPPAESGLCACVEFAVKHAIPLILEINAGIADEAHFAFNAIRDIAAENISVS